MRRASVSRAPDDSLDLVHKLVEKGDCWLKANVVTFGERYNNGDLSLRLILRPARTDVLHNFIFNRVPVRQQKSDFPFRVGDFVQDVRTGEDGSSRADYVMFIGVTKSSFRVQRRLFPRSYPLIVKAAL
jgi:hypothetical protein